ncbi:hypothetical protein GIB67_001033 [Kingdonia uniflora]|uniref:Uncharacterized protein n=1 Tax=Kingdonia uniflora TaxID=39325 RepID=A0A7J7MG87_9MAGN|nr:hypothetical protein GIB67_001033 [Kingdonia uniflora]
MLSIVVKDRRRAIDRLEAAIGTYQRLLGLILKEDKGGGTVTDSNNFSNDKAAEISKFLPGNVTSVYNVSSEKSKQ